LIADPAGNLYGVTSTGGTYNAGVVFQLVRGANGNWSQKILYDFSTALDGISPLGRLALDQAGNLYGTTQYGGTYYAGTAFKLSPSGND
jgi:uncharacterized repeat protein (TIGR03803 family)